MKPRHEEVIDLENKCNRKVGAGPNKHAYISALCFVRIRFRLRPVLLLVGHFSAVFKYLEFKTKLFLIRLILVFIFSNCRTPSIHFKLERTYFCKLQIPNRRSLSCGMVFYFTAIVFYIFF